MRGASARERLPLLARRIVSIILISTPVWLVLASPGAVAGAATTASSSTSSIIFIVSSDKPNYTGTTSIVVSGIAPPATAVTISISNPFHVAVASMPATIAQDNSFRATFQAGGPAWGVSGKYAIDAILQTPDTVAPPPRANSSFFYTAVATTTTSGVSSVTASSGGSQGLDTSTFASIAGIVGVIVAAVALVGFMLRSRGRRRPPARAP